MGHRREPKRSAVVKDELAERMQGLAIGGNEGKI